MVDLDGATVAITGGARGIGRATALEFAKRGAYVVTGDLDPHESPGPALELDVTKPRSWAKFAKAAGTIDVLVNNAGVMPSGRFLEQSPQLLAAAMDINYWGVLHGLRTVLPGMMPRCTGRGRRSGLDRPLRAGQRGSSRADDAGRQARAAGRSRADGT